MAWATIALYVVSFLISAFLSPKPKLEDAKRSKFSDLKFPRASEGDPVPFILGKVLVESPNTLWYGGFRSVAIKKKVKTGLFSSKKVIVGYRYYLTADLGLALGEDCVLHKVWIEKKKVYDGPALTGVPQTFSINKPWLFGGEEGSGGYSGTHTFYSGRFDETEDAFLTTKLPGNNLGYVGISRIVLKDVYFGNSSNLRQLKSELSRSPNGLGLTSQIPTGGGPAENWQIVGEDLNPMEALYQVLVDDWGGLGRDPANIDTASMVSAAETLYNEGNGVSLQITSVNSGKDIIEEILRQVEGLMFQNSVTGKLMVKLIRDDYVVEDIPLFNESNTLEVSGFSRTAWEDTVNQLRLTYTNRNKNYEDSTIMVQDAANIAQQGEINSTSLSFPLCNDPDLALSIATRELAQLSVPLFKLTLKLNRTAYDLYPGAPIKVTWPNYNITSLVVRIQKFRTGALDDGSIVVDCVQDIFSANQSVFSPPVDTGWVEPDKIAYTPTNRIFTEVPFFLMKDLGLEVPIPPSTGNTFVATLAGEENSNQQGFTSQVEDAVAFPDPIVGVDHRPYSNTAKLNTDLAATSGLVDGMISVLVVKEPTTGIFFEDVLEVETQQGSNLFILNGELFTYRTFMDNGDGTYDLETVQRALLDTAFTAHTEDDTLFFFSGADEIVLQEFDGLDNLYARYSSFTSADETDIEASPVDSLTTQQRYDRPLPVDDITISPGPRSENQVVDYPTFTSFTVSWKQRNRNNNIIAWENSTTETPESTTTYTVVFKVDDVVKSTHAGIASGTSDPTPFTIGSGEIGSAEIVITTHRDGLDSWVDAVYPFTIEEISLLLLEDGFRILLESGDNLRLE